MRHADRLRSVAHGDGDWTIPPALPAATAVIIRDGGTGVEALLLRRPMTMRFAPGMWVFPGGRVDEGESALEAAVRETREETGIALAASALTFVDHWVTPEVESRRYDVRFFLVQVPSNAEVTANADEVDDVRWIAPAEALQAHEAGELPILRPTSAVLGFLAEHSRAEHAVESARSRRIRRRMPRPMVMTDGSLGWSVIDVDHALVLESGIPMRHAWETEGLTRT